MKKYILILALILLIPSSGFVHTQQIDRGVFGSGGGVSKSDGHSIHGTVSQSAVGYINDSYKHGVGFWYSIRMAIKSSNGFLVYVPNVTAAIGEEVTIPVMIEYKPELETSGARTYKAVISFNSTILKPSDPALNYRYDQEKCFVTLEGELPEEASALLASIKCETKLGNSPTGDIVIESFEFYETTLPDIIKKNGRIILDGICEEGDTLRLIKRTFPEGLYTIHPLPATNDKVTINYQLSEEGLTELKIIDLSGATQKLIFRKIARPGIYKHEEIIADLPNGAYFIMLMTPHEVHAKKLLIKK